MIVLVDKLWGRLMAFAFWPFIIIRRDSVTKQVLNHEMIHIDQQKEMLVVFAILWYVCEYFCKSVYYLSFDKAYKNLSFEREAYENELNLDYLDQRKKYAFLRYVIVNEK